MTKKDAEDEGHIEATADADPNDATEQDSLQEDDPLQAACIKVNMLRIEVDRDDDKIATNSAGAGLFLGFLHKTRERRKSELAAGEKELAELQEQADHLEEVRREADEKAQAARDTQASLLLAQRQAAEAENAASTAKKLVEHVQKTK